jgi:uracil-DNA glycosylase
MTQPMVQNIKSYLESLKLSGVDLLPVEQKRNLSNTRQAPVQANSSGNQKNALVELRNEVLSCTQCAELAGSRNSVVFGAGNAQAKLVFVGEAPGFDEDTQGLPFVGKAGQLLTKIIESIGLKREQVFICNVLKCRPPKNRNPLPEEISNCKPYLLSQLKMINPKVICALGNFASQTLLQTDRSISNLRGQFHNYLGAKLMCTYHPAYLLRNPSDKRKVWEDMKMIRAALVEA